MCSWKEDCQSFLVDIYRWHCGLELRKLLQLRNDMDLRTAR